MKDTTVIILAGGKSSRMGTNKALLKINGQTVIEQIVNECKKITENILIVTNQFSEYEFLNLPMVEDLQKGKGPLAGIQAGLTNSKTEKNFVVACDMPFVSAQIALQLLKDLNEYDAVLPEINNQLHPLFAAYRKNCLEAVNRSLENGQLRITHFLDQVSVKINTEKDLPSYLSNAFFNMNNPKEYEKAIQMTKKEKESRDKS